MTTDMRFIKAKASDLVLMVLRLEEELEHMTDDRDAYGEMVKYHEVTIGKLQAEVVYLRSLVDKAAELLEKHK